MSKRRIPQRRRTGDTMTERWDTFDRIWAKGMNGKMRMRLMEKVKIRGLEPTEENCRDYWMGYIRFYMNPVTGIGRHVNPRKNKSFMKQMKRLRNDNQTGKRSEGTKPYKMGGRNKHKKRPIQRRK